ncbi:MAG: cell envelope biogenesis protein OmpA [Citrobacter freundii]|nr:MAG: cell envelope biogenesis protein OmpA [Citrobacter freundii]
MLKRILFLAMIFVASSSLWAQVTTSSITGTAKSATGESLVGATITATHVPSGTVYTTIAKKDGAFNLPGLRVGGPYTIKVEFVGQQTQTFDNVFLQLGEPYNITATLGTDTKELAAVAVTGRGRRASTDKGGMSTVANQRIIANTPTLSRSITDFTKLTPQSNGTNFAGRDARYNNITMDGANLNNNFGLSSDPLPGSGNNPVSIDAIEEISVTMAPFDVRQGTFTGANIAAITKSGTNTFHGTAYSFLQHDGLVGDKVKNKKAANPDFKSKIYGGSIGGPIIKNKLFFFINGEYEQKPPAAGITFSPTGGSGSGNISTVTVADLKAVSDYVKSKGYDPGAYDNFPSFGNDNHKILAKIDWNINKTHKLTAKYSDFKGTQDFQPSQSGGINGANTTGLATYGQRFSNRAMGFFNTTYSQVDIVRSASLELNSNFRGRFANQFLVTYTKNSSDKIHNGGGPFPYVDILGSPAYPAGDNNNYITVGNEAFNGNNNSVINDIITATDNFTYFAGKHTLTGGVSYEYQKVGNMFMAGSQGYYVFRNVNDFITNQAPLMFSQTYSLVKGQDAIYSANMKIGQGALYVQDEINFNPRLRVTVGVRGDVPMYMEDPLENAAVSAVTQFTDINGTPTQYTTGKWPKAKLMLSPRVGFRWDMEGDRSMILRGGTGIYTGRIPFVYLTNIPSNSGMYQFGTLITPTTPGANLNNFLFNPDPKAYNPQYNQNLPTALFPTSAGTSVPATVAFTSKDFKFPQIWRTNIAVDKVLAKDLTFTAELMYTKDLNAIYMFNANQKAPDGTVTSGSDTRGRYSANTAAVRRLYVPSGRNVNAIVLDNTSRGSSFVATVGLTKAFNKNWFASVAYTYTYAQDVTGNSGSQAGSVWQATPTSRTQNNLELAYSSFAIPHRIIANVSYKVEYLKHLATTITLVYEGRHGGTYSYIYNGDYNNDGNTADLMYIPKSPSEINFASVTYNGVTYTPQQQSDLFFKYIAQDPYLSKHQGQVAERNGAKLPFYHRLDGKLVQDIFTNIGKQKHTLQFTADVFNVLNLLNKDWGIREITTIQNPLQIASVANGVPTFRLTSFNNAPVAASFQDNVSTSTTWAMQLGLRYSF